MRLVTKTVGAAIFALGLGLLGAPGAQATFITGSISLGGGGLTVPPAVSTSIVSQLNNITQSGATVTGGSCTGAFGSCPPPSTATSAAFNLLSPFNTNIYSVIIGTDTFTFDLATVGTPTRTGLAGSSGSYTDALQVSLQGAVTDSLALFQPTQFTGNWSANGACTGPGTVECTGNITSSWSVSLSATGTQAPPVPEPASLSLLGAGLVGLGAIRRRFAKKS